MKQGNYSKNDGTGGSGQENCADCGKPVASAEQAGNMVAHMFQDNYCSCRTRGKKSPDEARSLLDKLAGVTNTVQIAGQDRTHDSHSGSEFCPRCGLKIARSSLPGSLTGYIFQDVRCKCTPEADFSEGAMQTKLAQLKKSDFGKTFSDIGEEERAKKSKAINLAEGAIIGGSYRIKALIGTGGMGEVYLADHIALDMRCALKVIPPEEVTESAWLRFRQEARTIAKLDHVNLVKVSDLGIHEGCLPFYAMELVDGKSLADLLEQNGPLPLAPVIEIFSQVCDGVGYAHRAGIIHRDLKPANIMVAGRLMHPQVKILDFGLAKLTQLDRHHQSLTRVGTVFGSPFYMSPEQCAGEKADIRSDIYSLGCTIFQCLTGRPPFDGAQTAAILIKHQKTDPPSLASLVGPRVFPDSMEVVIAKLLRKNPVERYQTLGELKGDLERVKRGENVLPFYMSRSKRDAESQAHLSAINRGDTAGSAQGYELYSTNSSNRGRGLLKILSVSSIMAIALAGAFFLSKKMPARLSQNYSTAAKAKLLSEAKPPVHAAEKTPVDTSDLSDVKTNGDSLAANLLSKSEVPSVAPKSASDTTPFSKMVTGDGPPRRVFTFPTDVVIGDVRPLVGYHLVPASGVLSLPANRTFSFSPRSVIAGYPSYYKRFRPGEVSALEVSAVSDPNLIVHSWKQFPDFPHIKSLNLYCETKLDDESMQILKTCSALGSLTATSLGLDAKALAGLPRLTKLHTLGLSGYKSPEGIFKAVQHSPNLVTLVLRESSLDSACLESIARLPALTNLDLGNTQLPADAIQILATAPHLEVLQVGSNFDSGYQTLKALRAMKALKQFMFESGSPAYNALTMQRLKTSLPNVAIKLTVTRPPDSAPAMEGAKDSGFSSLTD